MRYKIFLFVITYCLFNVFNGTTAHAKKIQITPKDCLEKVRDKAKKGDHVILRGGTYHFTKTLEFEPKHSGVTWSAYPGETVVFTGSIPVKNWTVYKDGIWKAKLNHSGRIGQLYVNQTPAKLAQLKKNLQGQGGYGTFEVKGTEPWAFEAGKAADGFKILKKDFDMVKYPEDLEFVFHRVWMTNHVCARDVIEKDSCYVFLLEQPMAAIQEHQRWRALYYDNKIEVYNALEFIDEPGEFYFDRHDQTLYYMPRENENLNVEKVEVPLVETLIDIKGQDLKHHVSDLHFEGIIFENTAWNLNEVAGSRGEGGAQSCAQSVRFGTYNWHDCCYQVNDLPCAAVEVNSADHIHFTNNVFRQIGSIGINFENDVCDVVLNGNVFTHIGSCAINVGHPQHVYIGKQNGDNEGHGPYNIDNSNDKWDETIEGLCKRVKITNNLIRHTGIQNPSNVVVSVYFGHHIDVSHNDIRFAPYTGISLGWGWEEFDGTNKRSMNKPSLSLRYNTIHHNRIGNVLQVLHDGGGIYLLARQVPLAKDSLQQEWSEVYANYMYDYGGNTRAGIHPDNGSRFFRFFDNVFDNIPWSLIKVSSYARKSDYRVYHNYANTKLYWSELDLPYSPNTVVKDNYLVKGNAWPEKAKTVIEESGLEPQYHHFFKFIEK